MAGSSPSSAEALLARGVRSEDVVALELPRGVEQIVAVVAVLFGSTAYDSFRESEPWVRFVQSSDVSGTLVSGQQTAVYQFAGAAGQREHGGEKQCGQRHDALDDEGAAGPRGIQAPGQDHCHETQDQDDQNDDHDDDEGIGEKKVQQ